MASSFVAKECRLSFSLDRLARHAYKSGREIALHFQAVVTEGTGSEEIRMERADN